MSIELLVAVIVVAWVVIGLTLALVMGRGGHEAFSWFVLGAIFGPLAVVLAFDARQHRAETDVTVHRAWTRGPGTTDVVIGVDGSPESHAAVRRVLDVFGPALGRLALVAVVPYDALSERERGAHDELRAAALELQGRDADLHVVRGKPVPALQHFGANGAYDVLAIGTRGRGRARALLGSVASELARGSDLPVLLVGGDVVHHDVDAALATTR